MKFGADHPKRFKINRLKTIESNPFFLSAKSSFRLLFKRQSEFYQLDCPLLVVSGLQRSGTHLVDNLLRNHHQILSYYHELQIGRPNKYYWPDLKNEMELKKRLSALIPRNMVKHFLNINSHQDFIFDFVFFKKIFLQLEQKNENFNQRHTLNNFFTAYFNAYLNCHHSNFYNGYKYIAVTIPGLTIIKDSIKGFFKDYPNGKLFVVIRDPFLWWNSARNHTKRLKKFGLERYQKTLVNTKWACDEYKNKVFAVSFDHLIKNTEKSMSSILQYADLEFNKIATYPSNFPNYAIDNSTFGHKKTKSVLKEKIKRELNIPEEDVIYIKSNIYPLYVEVLEGFTINSKEN
jgi:hypothetical protein